MGAGAERPAWMAIWTSCGPAPTWTCCWTKTPGPAQEHRRRPGQPGRWRLRIARTRRAGEAAGDRRGASRIRRPGQPDHPAGDPAGTWPTGPPRCPASAPSIPRWPATWPGAAARESQDDLVRDRNRRAGARHRARLCPTRTRRAVRNGRNDANLTRRKDPIRPAGPATPRGRDSPSWLPASTARRADTGPGRCTPGPAGNRIWSSRSTRSPPRTATTGSRPRGATPGSSSATCARSGMPPSCTGLVCPAARHAVADFEHNIPYEDGGRTCLCNGGPKCRHDHRLKRTPAGTSISSPTAPSGGPPRPAASTRPSPPATPFDPARE